MINKMSRQQKWQKKQKDAGKCIGCGDPNKGKLRCPVCLEKDRIAHIGMRLKIIEPSEEALDWARSFYLKGE